MSLIGIVGGEGGGGIPNPDAGTLADNEMVKANAGGTELVGTGDTNSDTEVDFGSKDVKCKTVITESSSVDVGPGVTLSDRGGFVESRSNVTGNDFLTLDYMIDDNGTEKPIYYSRGAKVVRDVVQPDDSTAMNGITEYSLSPTKDQDILRVYVKLVNPVTNYRARVTSDVTGEVVKYIPSRNDWDKGVGLDFAAGEQFFDLDSPLAELVSYPLTIEVLADQSIDVLGDGVDPWRAVDSQDITELQMLDETDVALESVSTSLILGGRMSEASPTSVFVREGKGRVGINRTEFEWQDQTVTLNSINTQVATLIGVNSFGNVVQLPPQLSPEVIRDYAITGIVSHPDGVIANIINSSLKADGTYSQLIDSLEVLGVTRKSGLAVTPNANLSFNKESGVLQSAGSGNDVPNTGENLARIASETPASFDTFLGKTDDLVLTDQTLIDPSVYDNGSGAPVAIGVPVQQATIIYLYQSVIQPGGLRVMYGQNIYSDLQEAILNAPYDAVDRPETIDTNTNLIARIAVRSDATDLSDDAQAVMLDGVKFGAGTIGSLLSAQALGSIGYELTTTSRNIGAGNDKIYVDSSAGPITLTLDTAPNDGLRHKFFIGDSTNTIELVSASPSFPIAPVPPVAESSLQGAWALTADLDDRFTTDRDLTNVGTGGSFDPVVVNGKTVNAFNFAGTAELEAVASLYKGVADGAPRSVTFWYAANAGTPTTNENFVSWGEDIPPGGLLWEVEYRADVGAEYLWVNNRNASRRWNRATLEALNLFDGNMHHIAVTQSNSNMGSVLLYIDGVQIPHDFQDTFPNNSTTQVVNFRLGASTISNARLNGKMYDFRLFDRGLSSAEVTSIYSDDLTGGVILSTFENRTIIEAVFNGSEWDLTDAVGLTLLDLDSRVGTIESDLASRPTVAFRTEQLDGLDLLGSFSYINTTQPLYYTVNGVEGAAPFTSARLTIEYDGSYQINVRGYATKPTGSTGDTITFYVSVNGGDYLANPNDGIVTTASDGEAWVLSGLLRLKIGDTVQIAYTINEGSGWDLNFHSWDIARVAL